MNTQVDSRLLSLADVAAGDDVIVKCVLFDQFRLLCGVAGVHAGDCLRCIGGTPLQLSFRTHAGTPIVIDRFYAAFVEVERQRAASGVQQPVAQLTASPRRPAPVPRS